MKGADLSKITVVTVVRNAARLLERTIESVLERQYSGLDYVIVDGASNDNTLKVIHSYEDHLKDWISEADHGVYEAMNKGWAMASSDSRILFLGVGDRLISLPGREELKTREDDVIYGNVLLDNDQVFKARTGFWLKFYNSLHHQGLLIPKRLHPSPPFDIQFPFYADFDFNQRLWKQGVAFRFSSALQTYALPAGLTATTRVEELTQIVRKNFGPVRSTATVCGFKISRILPLMKMFKPVR